ncbi:TetR/AcrR family transcriptional regulator [Paenibacillus sp. YYML68]|uniref:TetR/AcrR family transcriptional regulator n=1 Tax=Paenibacillus sp. YYML68 TaxID=2909250 RepID=UPI0024934338|nr:TetR/AcrR family transcriptional regulator [Paenibacillus sp. YYML68]
MPSKEEAAHNRRLQIIQAAAALFAELGYYKTTTAEVARQVGVTQPYIFHFFKSKEQLYLAVLEQASQHLMHAFTSVEAPPDRLHEAMGKAFARLLETNRHEIMLVMMSFATPEPPVREYTRQVFELVYDTVRQRFAAAGIEQPGVRASSFIGSGLVIALSETVGLPRLLPWCND